MLAVVILASGCIGMGGVGSGNVVKENREVSGFQEVSLDGMGNLIITQGDQESLIIEAEDNIIPHINSEVIDNKLEISYDRAMPTPTEEVNLYLTLEDIDSIEISGVGKIRSEQLNTEQLSIKIDGAVECNLSDIDVEELIITNSGAGRIVLSGSADQQTITINGAGDYDGADLESRSATITINGAGNAVLNVREFLKAVINGSGRIEYIGDPQLQEEINGIGTISQKS